MARAVHNRLGRAGRVGQARPITAARAATPSSICPAGVAAYPSTRPAGPGAIRCQDSGWTLTPAHWGTHLATQVEQLQARGSRVETIGPPHADEHLFGPNAMNLALRPAAARAGFELGRQRAEHIGEFWR